MHCSVPGDSHGHSAIMCNLTHIMLRSPPDWRSQTARGNTPSDCYDPGVAAAAWLRNWRGSSPWAPRKGCDWSGSPMPRPLPGPAARSQAQCLAQRDKTIRSCKASRATRQAWPASSSMMPPLCEWVGSSSMPRLFAVASPKAYHYLL